MKKTYLLTTAIFCTIQAFGGSQAIPSATNGALPASKPNLAATPATIGAPAGAPPAGMMMPPLGGPTGAPGMGAATDSDAPALPATFLKKVPPALPGALPSRKNKSNKTGSAAPLPIPNVKGNYAYVDRTLTQKTLDDATAFLVMDTGNRIACFADNNGVMRTGVLVSTNNEPAQCFAFDPDGPGKMFQSFFVPTSDAPIHWVVGTSSNPDQWITGKTDQMPTDDPLNPVTGICAQNDGNGKPALLGSAVRMRGAPHECILPSGRYAINRPEILVLAK